MFRDFVSSRAIQTGIVFFVLIVAGTQLYSWHVHRITKAKLGQIPQTLQQVKKKNKPRTAQVTGTLASTKTLGETEMPIENEDTQMSEATEGLPSADTETLNFVKEFLPDDFVSEEEPATDAPYGVSPFGFGPYPEVPPDFPEQDIWDDISTRSMNPNHELIARVQIKLWKQGVKALGGVYKNKYGLIYPIIDNVVYYEVSPSAGPGYDGVGSHSLTSPATRDKYGDNIREGIRTGIFPSALTVYKYPDGGIDPYNFLDLPR